MASVAMIAAAALVVAGGLRYRVVRRQSSRPTVRGVITLGRLGSLGGRILFPSDHPWNTRIDSAPVDSMSAKYIAYVGADVPLHPDFGTGRLGIHLYGIPYDVVDGTRTRKYRLPFEYRSESDSVEYPIPDHPDIEDGGDRHLLIVDTAGWRLYELYGVETLDGGASWQAGSGVAWDLRSDVSRHAGWTSADASGMAILPGLARADEVYDLHEIDHALRFTLPHTRAAYVYPARHQASSNRNPAVLPMGARLRLSASIDPEMFPPGAAVIVRALQRYGMILADNGGPLYLTGTADRRWKRADTRALTRLHASDFEVVAPLPPPLSDTVAWKEAPWKTMVRTP